MNKRRDVATRLVVGGAGMFLVGVGAAYSLALASSGALATMATVLAALGLAGLVVVAGVVAVRSFDHGRDGDGSPGGARPAVIPVRPAGNPMRSSPASSTTSGSAISTSGGRPPGRATGGGQPDGRRGEARHRPFTDGLGGHQHRTGCGQRRNRRFFAVLALVSTILFTTAGVSLAVALAVGAYVGIWGGPGWGGMVAAQRRADGLADEERRAARTQKRAPDEPTPRFSGPESPTVGRSGPENRRRHAARRGPLRACVRWFHDLRQVLLPVVHPRMGTPLSSINS